MKLVKSIMTKNPCYTAGRKITVKGLMLHSVGCPQPKAMVFINNWNRSDFGSACVHGFIDGNDGTVYQTLPWNHRGWHCASGPNGSGNNTHIGVEMCEPACIKYTGGSTFTCSNLAEAKASVKRTYNAAVELFAMLCEEYHLDPLADGVIISHKEGHARGIASDHGDPEHLWKGVGLGYSMSSFRKAVKAKMSNGASSETAKDETKKETLYRVRKTWKDAKTQKGAFKELSNAKECADKNPGYTVFDEAGNTVYTSKEEAKSPTPAFTEYKVKVDIDGLRIRKGPGTDCVETGKYTGKGVFTIVDESDGVGASKWGLLKSHKDGRDGWISLDHTKKI